MMVQGSTLRSRAVWVACHGVVVGEQRFPRAATVAHSRRDP